MEDKLREQMNYQEAKIYISCKCLQNYQTRTELFVNRFCFSVLISFTRYMQQIFHCEKTFICKLKVTAKISSRSKQEEMDITFFILNFNPFPISRIVSVKCQVSHWEHPATDSHSQPVTSTDFFSPLFLQQPALRVYFRCHYIMMLGSPEECTIVEGFLVCCS